MKFNALTSFTFNDHGQKICTETFRTFILNNQSLETLSLSWIKFEGVSNKPPVTLSNLKSFCICFPQKAFSALVRVPALQRLSSLVISATEDFLNGWFELRATGEEIAFTVKCGLGRIAETWQDITGYAKPTIRHVCLENSEGRRLHSGKGDGIIALFEDAHTLEIGGGYAPNFYLGFWDDLRKLGSQLKTVRFEIPGAAEPFQGSGKEYEIWSGKLSEVIEDLVSYRFKCGRPFSAIERMVVSENERVNREQDFVWRCFYDDRLDKYVRCG